ncbi:related to HCM1-transcription factor [Rhynchosporium graminicola]|uniref:Related to HCM1-transcription factor n=1 Tax=Rhynchosporium graminicola TaxID=2792576 RepID=A0A1E1L4H0_9HELO|nr:related to HCM1-transcription factor [Rhynchosporium commune]
MSSTRYSQQPMQIYQDPASSFDRAPMPSEQSSNTRKPSPLRPIKNAASRMNIVFNPPHNGPSKRSPSKSAQQASSSPSRASFGNKLNMVSMPPPGGPSYNTDSMEKKPYSMSNYRPQKALFGSLSNNASMDQENYSQPSYPVPIAPSHDRLAASNFSLEGLYGQKPPKRLMDAAPIHESRPFKRTKLPVPDAQVEDSMEYVELPSPDSFAPLIDDGSKPAHSYAQLIGMSILRAANRRLTLAQIYKWISDTYSFYSATDAGWQNSIRHNLSLNKAFIKQERPKDDPGKGNYWAIQPGMEHQFIKDKMARKPLGPNENVPVLSTTLSPVNLPETVQFRTPTPSIQAPELPLPPSYSNPEPQQSTIQDLSSDATIPGSDACNTDPEVEDEPETPSSPLMHSSPPAAAMRSSPPVARHVQKRHDTPPPVPRFPSSSRTRSHKRKYASMDDSGYFSSLDSSALRGHRLLTSEADQPRMKRGSAEEEIARLRGSSYDSPTKKRSLFAPPSSSPMRIGKKETSQMLPPLTPAVKLKPPVRPPPSVSPNTNLRLHRDRVREMVGSPLRGMTTLDENTPWSPAFNLDDNASYMFQDFSVDFDIFTDNSSGFLNFPGTGSPEKRSAKRPRLDRSKSANILADMSGANLNKSVTSTPLLKFTPTLGNSLGSGFSSPPKSLDVCQSPIKLLGLNSPTKIPSPNFNLAAFDLPQDDFFSSEFISEDIDEGWDIMQGFQKIGSGATGGNGNAPTQSMKRSPKAGCASRPGVSRSFTSRF